MSTSGENLTRATNALVQILGITPNEAERIIHSISAYVMRQYAEELRKSAGHNH